MACHQKTTVARQPSNSLERGSSKRPDTQQLAEKHDLSFPLKEPQIIVLKSKRQLELYSNGTLVRTYHIGLGFNPVDDKNRQGDGCTPEGDFYGFTKNERSAYYAFMGTEAGAIGHGVVSRWRMKTSANSIKPFR
jgi:murein L,D-transpeptidase YafK